MVQRLRQRWCEWAPSWCCEWASAWWCCQCASAQCKCGWAHGAWCWCEWAPACVQADSLMAAAHVLQAAYHWAITMYIMWLCKKKLLHVGIMRYMWQMWWRCVEKLHQLWISKEGMVTCRAVQRAWLAIMNLWLLIRIDDDTSWLVVCI